MKVAAVSDMHGMLEYYLKRNKPPEADILILGGDIAPNVYGPDADARNQVEWLRRDLAPLLKSLPFKHVVVIAGNHDWAFYVKETAKAARAALEDAGIHYLQDEMIELEDAGIHYLQDEMIELEGKKIYGSPWTPWFYEWAFMFPRSDPVKGHPAAGRAWAKIPAGLDVLVTHGPPQDILDLAPRGDHPGCPLLRKRVEQVKPKLHLFGHIHGGYGRTEIDGTTFGNVALCDEAYEPVQPIQVFEV